MSPVQVDGVVFFPWQIPVQPEALGMAMDVTIGGTTVRLTLPVPDDSGTLVAPKDDGDREFPQEVLRVNEQAWGHGYGKGYQVGAARTSCLLSEPDERTLRSEDARALGKAFNSWFDIVTSWASAWSRLPLGGTSKTWDNAFLFMTPNGDRFVSGGRMTVRSFMGIQPLSAAQVRSAFTKASSGTRLPVEQSLLQAARVAELNGDYRQAVIDSGTAAEVALGAAISADLRAASLPEEYVRQAVENVNGLVDLMSRFLSLGHQTRVSKNRAMDQLTKVRNRAAHAGYVPSPEETATAIRHARSLVEDSRPLPEV